MIDLKIKHYFTDGLYAKEMRLPKLHYAVSHRHAYDHFGALFSGKVVVEVNGSETEYEAPAFILVKAGDEHKITALEDTIWFCVHQTEETNVDNIDQVLIKGA